MSSRLTLILAAFFLLAALLAGYWGIVLSRPAAVPAPVTPAGEQPVVAVAHPGRSTGATAYSRRRPAQGTARQYADH